MHDGFMKVIACDFVNEVAATATLNHSDIGGKVLDLISFSEDSANKQPWEHLANVDLVDANLGIAKLDLESLLKALSSRIAIPLLYGHDYLERNLSTLRNWDCFASQAVPLLALGLPTWVPFPSFQQGVAARNRLLESLAAVYRRIRQHHDGEAVDYGADMSDVSETVLDRFKVFDRHRIPVDAIAQIELSLLWAQNKNTQQLLFWYVFYVYSVPGLLDTLRQEVSASGAISLSTSRRVTALDIPALNRNCLLLRASFLESFRLAEESVMFRQVTHPITLDDGTQRHQLNTGSWVSISNCRTKHAASLYPRPLEFILQRFIEDGPDGKRTVTYGPLRPWGIGPGMCKGRTFAEKQLLSVVPCIITLWDMDPADGGAWKHPGFKAGATVLAPAEKVRVRIR